MKPLKKRASTSTTPKGHALFFLVITPVDFLCAEKWRLLNFKLKYLD